ncbi:oleosin [Quercus suber]|uniref:Oleosin n=1 Tax=Quercus suber TaxID=58331 RepID=A0AAW0ISA9_QUESU
MAENREVFISGHEHQRHVHGSQVVCASLAGMAIGGPLLGTMGLSFMASVAILLVSTPLLLLFSPIIFFAGLVLGGAVAGFSVAALMAMSGLSTLEWVFTKLRAEEMWDLEKEVLLGREGRIGLFPLEIKRMQLQTGEKGKLWPSPTFVGALTNIEAQTHTAIKVVSSAMDPSDISPITHNNRSK